MPSSELVPSLTTPAKQSEISDNKVKAHSIFSLQQAIYNDKIFAQPTACYSKVKSFTMNESKLLKEKIPFSF